MRKRAFLVVGLFLATLGGQGEAFELVFNNTDTIESPVFSQVMRFGFFIPVDAPIAEMNFENPQLNTIEYNVSGSLSDGTPSGFSSFRLERTIPSPNFYSQGSSLSFRIAPGANLHDGLQVADLAGPDPVFVFNAREVNTGRYHPPLVELNSDGTGRIQNSNNFGGINPATNRFVDVDFGEEYITDLSFNPANFTLAQIIINGDFDEDGSFDCSDIDALVVAISTESNNLAFDLNNDGQLDGGDIDSWLLEAGNQNIGSGYILGDANFDGAVDGSDFNIWNENKFTNTAAYCSGDFNADGAVDGSDFNVWNQNKFTSAAAARAQTVPEPSAFWILAMLGTTTLFRRQQL